MMTKWEAKAFEHKEQLIQIALCHYDGETSDPDYWVVTNVNGEDYDLNVWIDDEVEPNVIKVTAYPLTYKFLDITERALLL